MWRREVGGVTVPQNTTARDYDQAVNEQATTKVLPPIIALEKFRYNFMYSLVCMILPQDYSITISKILQGRETT